MADKNYTLGRGELHFGQFAPGTQTPNGERYFGNTPEFSLTINIDTLDHYDSDHGVKELDDSIVLQTTRTGAFTTDNISPENLALFFFGSADVLATSAATNVSETFTVQPGLTYQLGTSDAAPSGVRKVRDVQVTVSGGTAPVVGTDYTVDADRGRITIVAGGAIAADTEITVTYSVAASARQRVISGSTPIEGALRFLATNPKGEKYDYFFPYVSITPNGDFALKGDDWQAIPFNISVKKKGSLEAIYVDGQPLFAA